MEARGLCWNFAKGNCKRGESCKYSHAMPVNINQPNGRRNKYKFKNKKKQEMLKKFGFSSPEGKFIPKALRSITPNGSTAIWDACVEALDLMVKTNKTHKWNFAHILLTDGEDNSSKCTFQEYQLKLRPFMGMKNFNAWLIGVSDKQKAGDFQPLRELASLGRNIKFASCDNVSMKKVFGEIENFIETVTITQTIQRKGSNGVSFENTKTTTTTRSRKERKPFIVVFSLDCSSSMNGERWDNLCSCVEKLLKALQRYDRVAAITFNQFTS